MAPAEGIFELSPRRPRRAPCLRFLAPALAWAGLWLLCPPAGLGPTAFVGGRPGLCRHRTARRLQDYEDPNAEWDPTFPFGRPPNPLKLPCTFRLIAPVRLYKEPFVEAELLPDRVIQKNTHFSVEEIEFGPRIRGVDVIFLRPKRAYYKKHKPDDGEDYGQGGWICDTCLAKGPRYLTKIVKRFRPMR
uniref:Uncharacterized protein n=1 Tax=Alexandrium monilatum TaxID=311494 RepID=A0A7S4R5A1_9DINO